MDALESLSKYLKFKAVNIYGTIFMLYSRFTVMILMACIFFLSTKQYFGDPISCLGSCDPKTICDTFCWTMGTYILVGKNNSILEDHSTIHYNDEKFVGYGLGSENNSTKRLYFRYYQWIVLMLMEHAMSFYFPSYLWKLWEGKRLESVCCDMVVPVIDDVTYTKKKNWLYKYFKNDNKIVHKSYAFKYITCEFLNLVTCLFNMWTMHIAFNNYWTDYAPSIFMSSSYDWENWNYISATIFPKITKCMFTKHGQSGSIESRDLICILPLNILNEKIFGFLGIWYIILLVLSTGVLIMYLILIFNNELRIALIHKRASFMTKSQIRLVLKKFSYGDWIFLNKISTSVNPVYFNDLIKQLYENVSNQLEV